MFNKTAIITSIALAMSAGAQADYDWELGAGYTQGKISKEVKQNGATQKTDTDTDEIDLSATWFMETVDTSKGPLGEAAFLDHASSIKVVVKDGKVELTNQNNDDGQTYEAKMRYVAEGPGWELSGWLVDLGVKRSEPGNQKYDHYNVGVGKYITENTTLVFNYANTGFNNGNGSGTDTYGGTMGHFFAIGDGGLKAEGNFSRTYVPNRDDIDNYGVGVTYYLGSNLGFGANWEQNEINGWEINTYGVSAQWFISENLAVSLSYQDITPDEIKLDNGATKLENTKEELAVTGLFRF
jgi:hypothetical protein